jgi:zinc transporter ZupT
MKNLPLALLIVPVFSTLLGGLLAIRFRRSISILVAASAGVLLGATFLDLLPEALDEAKAGGLDAASVLSITLISFLVFFCMETAFYAFSNLEKSSPTPPRAVGRIAGAMLVFHSFRDGMAIGASYAASAAAGYAVAIGIAAHDLGDGMNTVLLTSRGEGVGKVGMAFLAADCIAPFAGGLFAFHWMGSARDSVLLLAIAAGFFLQMASSDFLPHVKECRQPRRLVLTAVLIGSSMVYFANRLGGTR